MVWSSASKTLIDPPPWGFSPIGALLPCVNPVVYRLGRGTATPLFTGVRGRGGCKVGTLEYFDGGPLGLPQPGLDGDARLFPDHLMAALVRVEETEEQHRAHIGYHAVARALGDYASAQLTKRLLARGVEDRKSVV